MTFDFQNIKVEWENETNFIASDAFIQRGAKDLQREKLVPYKIPLIRIGSHGIIFSGVEQILFASIKITNRELKQKGRNHGKLTMAKEIFQKAVRKVIGGRDTYKAMLKVGLIDYAADMIMNVETFVMEIQFKLENLTEHEFGVQIVKQTLDISNAEYKAGIAYNAFIALCENVVAPYIKSAYKDVEVLDAVTYVNDTKNKRWTEKMAVEHIQTHNNQLTNQSNPR